MKDLSANWDGPIVVPVEASNIVVFRHHNFNRNIREAMLSARGNRRMNWLKEIEKADAGATFERYGRKV